VNGTSRVLDRQPSLHRSRGACSFREATAGTFPLARIIPYRGFLGSKFEYEPKEILLVCDVSTARRKFLGYIFPRPRPSAWPRSAEDILAAVFYPVDRPWRCLIRSLYLDGGCDGEADEICWA